MKKAFIYSALALALLAGCQAETYNSTSHNDSGFFTATIEEAFGDESKTYLDSDGIVRWKQGDLVSVFAGSTSNEQYKVTDDSEGKTEATMSKVTSDVFVAGTEMDSNVALYPYAPAASIAQNSGAYTIDGIVLPASQTYAEESFGNGAFPMVAVTGSMSDDNLKFKNILGGLKLQLKGTATISSVSVTGNNGEILCGAAQITASASGAPSISLTDETEKTVTLYCRQGVSLNEETATSFVIALPPVTMTAGFTVLVRDTEGRQMEINTDKTQTIIRSSLLKMPSVTYKLIPVSGVSLNESSVALEKGKSLVLVATVTPSNATDKGVVWTSSDESIVTVDKNGKVTAKAKGTATIKATARDGSGEYKECRITVIASISTGAVNLGLPSGIKWAGSNLSESGLCVNPWDYGDYYAWGETIPYYQPGHSQDNPCSSWRSRVGYPISGYDWASYKFWISGDAWYNLKFSKYNAVDNITELQRGDKVGETIDDAARAVLRRRWRMPTDAEWTELMINCNWEWIENIDGTGINGRLVTASNGNCIFLPAAGVRGSTRFSNDHNVYGYYWSSTLESIGSSVAAFCALIDTEDIINISLFRYYGHSVRPVYE